MRFCCTYAGMTKYNETVITSSSLLLSLLSLIVIRLYIVSVVSCSMTLVTVTVMI